MKHDPRELVLEGLLKEFGDIESSKCGDAFDESSFDAAHAGKFKLRFAGVAAQLDHDFVISVARDLTGGRFHFVVELRA